jgi:hypothetical protein
MFLVMIALTNLCATVAVPNSPLALSGGAGGAEVLKGMRTITHPEYVTYLVFRI